MLDSTLDALMPTGDSEPKSQSTFSLSDLWNSTLASVQAGAEKGISQGVADLIAPPKHTQNAQPVPDLAAKAATPKSGFLNGAAGGANLWIVLGVAAVGAFLILRKR